MRRLGVGCCSARFVLTEEPQHSSSTSGNLAAIHLHQGKPKPTQLDGCAICLVDAPPRTSRHLVCTPLVAHPRVRPPRCSARAGSAFIFSTQHCLEDLDHEVAIVYPHNTSAVATHFCPASHRVPHQYARSLFSSHIPADPYRPFAGTALVIPTLLVRPVGPGSASHHGRRHLQIQSSRSYWTPSTPSATPRTPRTP